MSGAATRIYYPVDRPTPHHWLFWPTPSPSLLSSLSISPRQIHVLHRQIQDAICPLLAVIGRVGPPVLTEWYPLDDVRIRRWPSDTNSGSLIRNEMMMWKTIPTGKLSSMTIATRISCALGCSEEELKRIVDQCNSPLDAYLQCEVKSSKLMQGGSLWIRFSKDRDVSGTYALCWCPPRPASPTSASSYACGTVLWVMKNPGNVVFIGNGLRSLAMNSDGWIEGVNLLRLLDGELVHTRLPRGSGFNVMSISEENKLMVRRAGILSIFDTSTLNEARILEGIPDDAFHYYADSQSVVDWMATPRGVPCLFPSRTVEMEEVKSVTDKYFDDNTLMWAFTTSYGGGSSTSTSSSSSTTTSKYYYLRHFVKPDRLILFNEDGRILKEWKEVALVEIAEGEARFIIKSTPRSTPSALLPSRTTMFTSSMSTVCDLSMINIEAHTCHVHRYQEWNDTTPHGPLTPCMTTECSPWAPDAAHWINNYLVCVIHHLRCSVYDIRSPPLLSGQFIPIREHPCDKTTDAALNIPGII